MSFSSFAFLVIQIIFFSLNLRFPLTPYVPIYIGEQFSSFRKRRIVVKLDNNHFILRIGLPMLRLLSTYYLQITLLDPEG